MHLIEIGELESTAFSPSSWRNVTTRTKPASQRTAMAIGAFESTVYVPYNR